MTDSYNRLYMFVTGLFTTNPMFALNLIAAEYRSKKCPLSIAFLDLEKAFDRVPKVPLVESSEKVRSREIC